MTVHLEFLKSLWSLSILNLIFTNHLKISSTNAPQVLLLPITFQLSLFFHKETRWNIFWDRNSFHTCFQDRSTKRNCMKKKSVNRERKFFNAFFRQTFSFFFLIRTKIKDETFFSAIYSSLKYVYSKNLASRNSFFFSERHSLHSWGWRKNYEENSNFFFFGTNSIDLIAFFESFNWFFSSCCFETGSVKGYKKKICWTAAFLALSYALKDLLKLVRIH